MNDSPHPLAFHPRPRIEKMALANGAHCFVIDDALLEPQRLVDWALATRDVFRPVDFNAYPGVYRMLPDASNEALRTYFMQQLRGRFDARRLLEMHARLAMVTLPEHRLRPFQWLCHSDNFSLDAAYSIQASVLYLFPDESLGGTSFYAPLKPAPAMSQLFADAATMSGEAFTARHGIAPGYMLGDNAYFRLIGRVPARWNRMIVYDGTLLHSADILAPDRLSDDPARGRLTLNGFFVCRRYLA